MKRKHLPRVLGLPYLCAVESRRRGTPLTPCFLPPRGQGTSKHPGAESEEGGRMVLQSMHLGKSSNGRTAMHLPLRKSEHHG